MLSNTKIRLQRIADIASVDNLVKGIRDPKLAYDYLSHIPLQAKKSTIDLRTERTELPVRIGKLLDVHPQQVKQYLSEIENDESFYDDFGDRQADLQDAGVIYGSTSVFDARTMYVMCRVLKPEVVVQTGVRYGSFDAHIAAALEANGSGSIYAIDLPEEEAAETELGAPEFDYGYLIPDGYRDRWNLRLGDVKTSLPQLLDEFESIDLFLHDSLHTYAHMFWEYETVYDKVRSGGAVTSHDIILNDSFQNYADRKGMDRTEVKNVGIARKN